MGLDFDYTHINEGEAARILTNCWPLVFVLTAHGYKAELDTENQLRLHNFKRLRMAGWLERSLIQLTARMNQVDIALLSAAADYQLTERRKEFPNPGNG